MFVYCMKTVKDIYGKYSGKFALPGDKAKFMSCIEFVDLIDQLGILADAKDIENQAKKATERQSKEEAGNNLKKGVQQIKEALLYKF